jgi:hypothetical protein
MPPPLHGLGAYARVLLQLYLIYLAIFKRVKITGWYFILYALANMVGIQRVLSLSNNSSYTRIHGFSSVFEMPHYHEFVASSFVNLFAGIYILNKR